MTEFKQEVISNFASDFDSSSRELFACYLRQTSNTHAILLRLMRYYQYLRELKSYFVVASLKNALRNKENVFAMAGSIHQFLMVRDNFS